MDRNKIAPLIVLAAMGGALVFLRGAQGPRRPAHDDEDDPRGGSTFSAPSRSEAESPQDVIYRMYENAAEGKVKAYLACFEGELQEDLKRISDRMGERSFAEYLIDTQALVKGIAVATRGKPFEDSGDRREFEVELIFVDRYETQIFALVRRGRRWRIAAMSDGEYRRPPVPYNSPAVPMMAEPPDEQSAPSGPSNP